MEALLRIIGRDSGDLYATEIQALVPCEKMLLRIVDTGIPGLPAHRGRVDRFTATLPYLRDVLDRIVVIVCMRYEDEIGIGCGFHEVKRVTVDHDILMMLVLQHEPDRGMG